ncbi:MAG: hypothetical protein V4673_17065 [Pseudomonadota bacterium]
MKSFPIDTQRRASIFTRLQQLASDVEHFEAAMRDKAFSAFSPAKEYLDVILERSAPLLLGRDLTDADSRNYRTDSVLHSLGFDAGKNAWMSAIDKNGIFYKGFEYQESTNEPFINIVLADKGVDALNVKRNEAAVRLRVSESERFRSITEDLDFLDSSDQVAGIFRAADLLGMPCLKAKKTKISAARPVFGFPIGLEWSLLVVPEKPAFVGGATVVLDWFFCLAHAEVERAMAMTLRTRDLVYRINFFALIPGFEVYTAAESMPEVVLCASAHLELAALFASAAESTMEDIAR